ncbi:metallophosphoesterase family protein [Longimicrobium sp.]|uniref:metallophosphoesterase family protein n=1 Tax=Longimicrobium sp. TaxID=2029185 RepID=UPI002D0614AD|nr:metallophosphoesterase family protein [Longimicrobium sp.]HSU17546.1 metallophosphoesterase family protein [Longimicrobium sp.]
MPIAALYDIHGNLPALEAVLGEIRREGVDRIVVGGDVLPGPMPREAMEMLMDLDLPVDFIRGNGDRAVLEEMTGIDPTLPASVREVVRWTAAQLDPHHARTIAAWPETLSIPIAPLGDVFFCHATPRDDTGIFTRLTPEDRLLPLFEPLGMPLVICGHTHMQFDRTIGRTRVVNAGSVGMPFGDPGAYWLLLGPDVQLRRTEYDLRATAGRIRATAYPQAEDFAANNVLHPPSEAAMLEAFARAEVR